jgi:ABC-type phosphate transport system substrate-binding protein
MRKTIVGATFVVFAAGASAVGALDNVALQGSDTLEQLTKSVLLDCPGATSRGITYVGGGSTAGGNAMMAGTQTVSPQSRALNPTEGCHAQGNAGADSEGLVIALDGLSIVTATSTGGMCAGGLAFNTTKTFPVFVGGTVGGTPVVGCPGCDAGTNNYRLGSWKDVLALVYAGIHPTTPTPVLKDCNGDVRRSLVNQWNSLFEGACPAGQCPAGLQRAFRRADLSGTTDTFAALVGLGSLPLARTVTGAVARPIDFCNAFGAGAIFGGDSDYLDNDPIRRTCATNEQVCGRLGHLGLVTVIEIPANRTVAENFPTALCGFGQFRFVQPALFGFTGLCPNGQPRLFAKCFQPVIVAPDGMSFTSDCLPRRFPVQGIGGATIPDGRGYNLTSRNADGSYRRDNLNRFITGAFFRLHTSATVVAGATTCQKTTSTDQIGCLTQANNCTIGFAGREATGVVPGGVITALTVNGLAPTDINIEALVTTPSTTADDYPLSRKLWFNTIRGFEDPTLATGEYELAKCFGKSGSVAMKAKDLGFVPVPGGVRCESFTNTTTCPASSTDSCTNNPPDLLSP